MANHFHETTFDSFTWIDIESPSKEQAEKLLKEHNLNRLLVRDSMESGHLPKIEVYPEYTFMILRAYSAKPDENVTNVQELSDKVAFFIKDSLLITIHRKEFNFINELLAAPKKEAKQYGLLIQILQSIVQSYEEPSDWQSEKIDDIESIIFLKEYSKISLEDLYYQKAEARISKKVLMLTQNIVNQLKVPSESIPSLQDVKDTLVKLILAYEEVLEDSNNLMNTYLSVTAQRSNHVMKLLTIFSAFFLPLTFIVGLYGMNFEYMPELKWKFGYLFVIILMVAFVTLIFLWFKRKKIM